MAWWTSRTYFSPRDNTISIFKYLDHPKFFLKKSTNVLISNPYYKINSMYIQKTILFQSITSHPADSKHSIDCYGMEQNTCFWKKLFSLFPPLFGNDTSIGKELEGKDFSGESKDNLNF